MLVKATVSFCGSLSMIEGQELEVQEGEILSDLLKIGYVIPVPSGPVKAEEKPAKTPKNSKSKKAVNAGGKSSK